MVHIDACSNNYALMLVVTAISVLFFTFSKILDSRRLFHAGKLSGSNINTVRDLAVVPTGLWLLLAINHLYAVSSRFQVF